MAIDWVLVLRWVHVLAASGWLGEVAVLNVVLIPSISRFSPEGRRRYLDVVFPRVFRLASVLSALTVLSGAGLLYAYTGGRFAGVVDGRWGTFVFLGGGLGLFLAVFHFFLEDRLAQRVGIGDAGRGDEPVDEVHRALRVAPRLGLAALTVAYVSMLYAVRGL